MEIGEGIKDILNKRSFYDLYEKDIFNRPKYLTYQKWLNHEYADIQLWICRNKYIIGSKSPCIEYKKLNKEIFDNYSVGEYLPGQDCIIQGHYSELIIEISFDPTILKYCKLKEMSKVIFKNFIGIENYHYLNDLIETYKDHIIEFSLFKNSVGIFSHPLIIWEIRKY
jgi:hypothetical protein